MWFPSWPRSRDGRPAIERLHPSRSPRRRPRFRPGTEVLDKRCLLSTLTVANNLDSGTGSLRAEIAAARSGDTIVFASGLDGQTITLSSGELVINTSLTIQGPGPSQLAISGGGVSRVFEVDGASTNVTLSGLTITQGNGLGGALPYYGGGILNNVSTLTLSGCTLSQNSGSLGGAIENIGTVAVNNCTLSGNQAEEGGGIANETLQGKVTASATVSGCTLSGNVAYEQGGGIANSNASMTISGCTLSGNSSGIGGGIYNYGTVTVSGCMLSGNSAVAGGGVYNEHATATITNSTVSNNIAQGGDYGEGEGGGIYNYYGTVTMSGCTLSGNSADYGGAVYTDGQLQNKSKALFSMTMIGCTVTGNAAWYAGGGFYNASSGGPGSGLTLIITNCTLSNNGPSLSIAYVGPFGGSGDTFS